MTRKLTSAVAIAVAAIGILTATAVPALGHEPRSGEAGVSPTSACPMAGDGMGSLMGMMGHASMHSMMGHGAWGGMMDPRSMGPMGSMMGSEWMHSMMDHGAWGGMMDPRSMGSMMGPDDSDEMMGPDAMGSSGPVDEDTAVDPADHAAHHPAATPEPTE